MKQLTAEANFNIGLVVRETIIIPKFWRQAEQRKQELLVSLNQALNQVFDTQVSVQFLDNEAHYTITGGGAYTPDETVITLSKTSIMTYLYMYAMHLAHKGFEIESVTNWAHTIFCLASRWTYFDSRNRGLFFHTPDTFVAPLAGATNLEEVEVKYQACVAALNDENLVALTAKVDGD